MDSRDQPDGAGDPADTAEQSDAEGTASRSSRERADSGGDSRDEDGRGSRDEDGRGSRDEDGRGSRDEDGGDSRDEGGGPGSDSVVDLARQPIVAAWTAYLTLLFALVAVGFGLFGLFSDAIDEGIVEPGDGPTGFDAALEAAFSIPLTGTPYLAILLAVFIGAGLGWGLERDRPTMYVTAGVCTGVATAVFWTLAALFGTLPLEVSVDIGGLLVNAILAGIIAGLVAAGGVWATLTRAPRAVRTTGRSETE